MNIPTLAQRTYVVDLMEKLVYDTNEYDFASMTREEMSELIAELKDQWEG